MDKLERVARALCKAHGKDPDGESGRGGLHVVTRGNLTAQEQKPWPNWRLHEQDARAFIAAHEALADGA